MFTFNNTQGNDNLKAFKKKENGMKIILFDFFLNINNFKMNK